MANTTDLTASDTVAPQLKVSSPGNGHKLVTVTRNIDFIFNEKITAGTGNLILSNGTGDLRTISITDPQFTVSGRKLTFNPTDDFVAGSQYTVQLDAGAVKDEAGNDFTGNGDGFRFSTQPAVIAAVPDEKAPTLSQFSPKDGTTAVTTDANIKLIFNESLRAGTGDIVISNGSDVRTIAITDASQVTITNNVLLINPTTDLMDGTTYTVTFGAGVVTDKAGNAFAGIIDTTKFNFTVGIETVLTGKAIDGYIKDGNVFADANGNGIWDNGEAKAITNGNGEFVLTGAKGALVISGGTDLSTGKAFEGILKAPEGSNVVSPLTTIQQGFVEQGQSVDEAEQSVAQAFGFDASQVDLTKYDPIIALSQTETAGTTSAQKTLATQLMASSAQVANFLVTSTQTLQGAAGGTENLATSDVGAGLIKALVAKIDAGIKAATETTTGTPPAPFKLDLSDAAFLKDVLVEGAKETNNRIAAVLPEGTALPELPKFDPTVFLDKIDKMSDNVVNVLRDAAVNIDAAVTKGGSAVELLTNFTKVTAFVQNDAGKALQDAALSFNPVTDATGDAFKALISDFSGSKALAAIEVKAAEVNPFQGMSETALNVIKDLAGYIPPVIETTLPPATGTGTGSAVPPLTGGTLPPAGTGTVPPTTGALTPEQQAIADALAAEEAAAAAAAAKTAADAKAAADALAAQQAAAATQAASDALHGTISSQLATAGTTGDDFLNATRGTITGAAVEYTLAGNDQYIFDVTTSPLPAVNVKISSFGAGDKLVFNVATTSTGLTTVDALYAVSDNGTDVKLIANQAGNVQYITLVGASSLASDSIDSVTELGTALGSNSILFI